MRSLLRSVALSSLLLAGRLDAQSSAPSADKLVAAGIARAKAEHKLVLVDFGASWCGWCHKFDKFLADTAAGVGRTMQNTFVIVPVVVFEELPNMTSRNNPGSDTLLKHYRGSAPDGGIPFYAMLDTTGRVLGTSHWMPDHSNIGHPDKDDEIEAFDKLLQTAAPRITRAQRDSIRAYLIGMRPKG